MTEAEMRINFCRECRRVDFVYGDEKLCSDCRAGS